MTVGEVNRLSREVDRINRIIDTLDPSDPEMDLYLDRLEEIQGRLQESLDRDRAMKTAGIRATIHIKMKELRLEMIPGGNRLASTRGIAKLTVVKKSRRKRA